MVQGQQQERLDELGLDGRGADRQDRLMREDWRALGHRVDIPGEAEGPQVVQKRLVKHAAAPEIGKIRLGKVQVVDIVDHLLQARRDGKAALIRAAAEKDVKIGDGIGHAVDKIAVAHGQLIKIAEHGQIRRCFLFHNAPQSLNFAAPFQRA